MTSSATQCADDPPADATDQHNVTEPPQTVTPVDSFSVVLRELRQRSQPTNEDDWIIPSLDRQRADAFVALFLDLRVELTTEVLVDVLGDGTTFDDGTPVTKHAVLRQLDQSFIRLLIRNADRQLDNASSRHRYPTTRQKRVMMEAHWSECVDCQSTELLELDHTPPYRQTLRTVTNELEPHCAPCHRVRHRLDGERGHRAHRSLIAVL